MIDVFFPFVNGLNGLYWDGSWGINSVWFIGSFMFVDGVIPSAFMSHEIPSRKLRCGQISGLNYWGEDCLAFGTATNCTGRLNGSGPFCGSNWSSSRQWYDMRNFGPGFWRNNRRYTLAPVLPWCIAGKIGQWRPTERERDMDVSEHIHGEHFFVNRLF
jgi:hypothetical protein